MRILYFCNVNRKSQAAVGVFKKIDSQIAILRKTGHEVDLACYLDENSYSVVNKSHEQLLSINLTGKTGNRRTKSIIREVRSFIYEHQYDSLYSRFETYSLTVASFYKHLKKNKCRVLLEVPTYPISQRWTTIKTSIENKKYKVALHQIFNATFNSLGIFRFRHGVDRIVTNNGYSMIWKIPTLKIHNAVDVNAMKKHSSNRAQEKTVAMIGVANVAKWHGYDRVIAGLSNYYREERGTQVIFHIVGNGLEINALKALSEKGSIQDKVIFHGTVVGEALDSLFDVADIGVSILGSHRSHMKSCDSLKSKEYCARNLPFITGKIEEIYNDRDFVLMVEDSDSPVDICEVVAFVQKIYANGDFSVHMEEYAKENCGWNTAFSTVLEFYGDSER